MKPMFTVHEGEYLVGSYLEQKGFSIWLPAKDRGIDLLVSKESPRRCVSIQVKFSKDYSRQYSTPALRNSFLCGGWWTLSPDKIRQSTADYWVFVTHTFNSYQGLDAESREIEPSQFIVIRPADLALRLELIHGQTQGKIQSYFSITRNAKTCIETRGLNADLILKCASGILGEQEHRNFSQYLNNWQPIIDDLERAS